MATPASQLNDKARSQRRAAARTQRARKDLDGDAARAQRRLDEANEIAMVVEAKQTERQEIFDQAKEIKMGAKALTKEIAALYDRAEELGFDRKEFKNMLDLRKEEASKRLKREATRRQLARAFGFESGEQIDAFIEQANAELDAEAGEGETKDEGELSQDRAEQIGAHIAKHGTKPIEH